MSQAQAADEILLRVPARAPYARIVRDGAAALAERQSFTPSQIKDLSSAAEEAVTLLLSADGQTQNDEDTDIECVFRLNNEGIEIEAARSDQSPLPSSANERFNHWADQLVDDSDLDVAKARIRLRVRHSQ